MTTSSALRRLAEYSGRMIAVAALFVAFRPGTTVAQTVFSADEGAAISTAETVTAVTQIDVDQDAEPLPAVD